MDESHFSWSSKSIAIACVNWQVSAILMINYFYRCSLHLHQLLFLPVFSTSVKQSQKLKERFFLALNEQNCEVTELPTKINLF